MAAEVVAVRVEVVAGVSTSGTSDGVTRSRLKGSVEPASRQPSLGGGLGGLVFSVVPACGAAAAGGGRSTAPEGAAERSVGGGGHGPSPGSEELQFPGRGGKFRAAGSEELRECPFPTLAS